MSHGLDQGTCDTLPEFDSQAHSMHEHAFQIKENTILKCSCGLVYTNQLLEPSKEVQDFFITTCKTKVYFQIRTIL